MPIKSLKMQPYIEQLMTYRDLFDDFPQIKFLINNVLESDRLIKNWSFTAAIA